MSEQFVRWIKADSIISDLKKQIAELEADVKKQELEAADARLAIAQEMRENGLLEDTIEGELINYKLYFSAPRASVDVDVSAVPDEFCKIERKPELKKIKEYIDAGNQVNWATIKQNEPKLTYKAVKKC